MNIKGVVFILSAISFVVSAHAQDFTVSLGIKKDISEARLFSESAKKEFPHVQICLNTSGNYIVSDGTITNDTSLIGVAIQNAQSKGGFEAQIAPIDKNKCFSPESFLRTDQNPKIEIEDKKRESALPVHIMPPDFSQKNLRDKNRTDAPSIKDNGQVIQDKFIHVYPDIVTSVWLSNNSVNRIVCEGGVPVSDVIYSDEKGITHKIQNDTVWLKYVALESSLTKELKYRNEPTELYVLCGIDKKTYAMVITPKFIDTQKIILKNGNKNIQKNQSLFKGLSTEEKILKLIKEAYNNDYQDSYSFNFLTKNPVQYGSLEINAEKEISIPGEGLQIIEFSIWNNPECDSPTSVFFDEKKMLALSIRSNPLLISVRNHHIKPGDKTKAYIIDFVK